MIINNETPNYDAGALFDSIGLQLWTVRNQLEASPQSVLDKIAQAGYSHVELMDTDQLALREMILEAGLNIRSSFLNWTHITGRWDLKEMEAPKQGIEYIIDAAAEAGLTELVFGYLLPAERQALDDYKRISEKLNYFGERCAKASIQLCYHHHSFEWAPIDNSCGWDVLVQDLDPELVKFELDIFWAKIAGQEPLYLMDQLNERIHFLHLKDIANNTSICFDESEVSEEAFKELGQGILDIREVIEKAENMRIASCIVEQDESPDPMASIVQSINYLNNLEL